MGIILSCIMSRIERETPLLTELPPSSSPSPLHPPHPITHRSLSIAVPPKKKAKPRWENYTKHSGESEKVGNFGNNVNHFGAHVGHF
jgi:hypothetical protein